eukprot:3573171-Rhodomonas_salina.2
MEGCDGGRRPDRRGEGEGPHPSDGGVTPDPMTTRTSCTLLHGTCSVAPCSFTSKRVGPDAAEEAETIISAVVMVALSSSSFELNKPSAVPTVGPAFQHSAAVSRNATIPSTTLHRR